MKPLFTRPAALAGAAALVIALSACGGETPDEETAPVERDAVTVENCGVQVTITEPVERAVADSLPAAELLLALGLEDRMAALIRDDGEVLPELAEAAEKVPTFEGEKPSFESVLDLEPDLVYSTFNWTFTEDRLGSREEFEKVGVQTYLSMSECGGQDAVQDDALTLEDVYTEIEEIATIFGVEDRGEELVTDLQTRAEEATVDLGAEDVTLAWWYAANETPYIAGCCGAPGIITDAVGATNAFEDSRQLWPEMSWEVIVDRDPTVLVLADASHGLAADDVEEKIDFLESNPVTKELTAVRNKRYVILDAADMDPGIRNVSAIEKLAAGLRDIGVVD